MKAIIRNHFTAFLLLVSTVSLAGEEIIYDNNHIDIDIAIAPDSSSLILNTIFDENLSQTNPINQSVFLGNELSEFELTPELAPFFPWLGNEGDIVYNFPTNNRPGMIWLGLSSYTTDSTMFNSTFIDLNYLGLQGPGNFFMNTGGNTPFIDSTSGTGAPQKFQNLPGGHEHMNWWFTDPGLYKITVQAEGELANNTPIQSEPTNLRFMVNPQPHERWLVELLSFDVVFDGVDLVEPQTNGRPLLVDYAFDLDPSSGDNHGLPHPVLVGASSLPGLIYRAPEGRTDLIYRIEGSSDLTTWDVLIEGTDYTLDTIDPASDGTPQKQVTLLENPQDRRYFLRVSLELVPSI